MISTQFVAQALVVLFSIPLIANSDIRVDFKPLEKFVLSKTAPDDINTEHLKMATESLAMASALNAKAEAGLSMRPEKKPQPQDEKLDAMLKNISHLMESAGDQP